MLSVDLDDPSVVDDEATLTTEQLGKYRPSGGKLYAPFLDPQGGIGNPQNGSYAVCVAFGQPWVTVDTLTPYTEHVYDVVETGAGIFALGLAETVDGDTADFGQVWHSTDDGATWTSEIPIPGGGWPLRLFAFGEVIIVFGTDSRIYRWDGTTWSDVGAVAVEHPDFTQTAERFTFGSDEFYLSRGGLITDPLSGIDTASLRLGYGHVLPLPRSMDRSEDDQHFYVLTLASRVYRYDTSGVRTVLFDLEEAAIGIAADEEHGLLWYGTTDSRVCAVALP